MGEVEKAKSDSLVSAENSHECSKKLDGAEAEVRKKETAIEKINKELAEKTSALAAAKQKEEELLKEKAKYEKLIQAAKEKKAEEKKSGEKPKKDKNKVDKKPNKNNNATELVSEKAEEESIKAESVESPKNETKIESQIDSPKKDSKPEVLCACESFRVRKRAVQTA